MTMYLGSDDQGTQESTLQDFAPTGMQKMNAAVREAWMESYGPVAIDWLNTNVRGGKDDRRISAAEADAYLKENGNGISMSIKPQDNQYTASQWATLVDRQRELSAVKDVRNRTPWELSSVARGAAMFGAGIVDPINLATAFVPWTRSISALRSVAATAAAGETFAARTGARALLGAADAGISTAVLEPLYYAGRQSLGDDYTAYDSMANIAFGTAFGGGVHTLGGALGDLMRYRAQRATPAIDPTPETLAAAVDMTPEQRLEAGIAPESARAGMPEIVEPVGRVDEAVAVTPDVVRLARRNERTSTYEILSPAGDVVGSMVVLDRNGIDRPAIQIHNVGIDDPNFIGQGLGVEAYRQIIDSALASGKEVWSDPSVSAAASRVYDAMKRRGYAVEENQKAEIKTDEDGTRYTNGTYVYKITDGPKDTAAAIARTVEPETREAALRASVAQMMDGREVDVDAIVGMDPNLATHTVEDVAARADANFAPENRPLSDVGASEAVDARNASAPKWEEMSAAEQAEAEAMALLDDTIKAGDQAFKYSRENPEAEYRIDHRPMTVEGGASTLSDLTGAFGEDIYGSNALQYYGSGDPREREILRVLKSVRGKPDATVTIYRGVPEGVSEINPGDWVTLSKSVAEDYGNVVSMEVPASHVTSWSDSLMEFGYYPPDAQYSRGDGAMRPEPMAIAASIRKSFGGATAGLIERGQIQIVATPKDIPGGPHPADVKAATAPDGTVYVVAENVSEAEARGIVLHEVGVHVGMREMLGADVFDSVLTELDDAILRGESWANDARAAVPADTLPAHVREEQLAYLVQNAPELGIVKRILAAVRAWAFRTFAAARERMTLTEADFRAMAVAALHDVAKRGEAAGSAPLELAYSRGETPDPSTVADELKPYDDAVARAKSYAGVLRAAADKLDNDAQAVAAMRAALPDITPAEIDNLLSELRKQVKGLRGVARTARTAMQSGDVANDLQFDAMQAADTLANNLQMAAVIEKRNAALNINARMKAATFVNQFRKPGLDFEGFRALLVGTERKRVGGRMSVEAEQKQFRGEWLGGMIADLEKQGLTKVFTSGDFDRDISAALWNLGKDGAGNERLPREAVQVAEIINKYQNDARNTRNRFGAWIRDLQGYIARQTHDMFKIREAGESDWVQFVSSRLDIAKMVRLGLISETDPMASLRGMYDDFAAGLHMKTPTDDSDLVAFRGTQNLAKKVSASRTLYFKDGNAAHEYNMRFGQGRLAELVLTGLDNAAKSAGLLKVLGTNPEATMQRLFDEYAESLKGDPVRRAQFVEKRKEMENLLAHVTGAANIPGRAGAAKINANIRAWVSMSRLGGALISSVTDLANYAAEMRFGQKKNLLGGVLDGIGAVTRGRAKGEKQQILSSLGVFHESTLGSVYARFDNPDLIGGKMSWAMQQFFKLNGLNWWTESLRDGYALAHSHYLAHNSSKKWDSLPNSLRDMLQLYNIDAGKWELLRMAPLKQADGRMYMTPDGLATIPQSAMEAYIISVGRKVSDAAILNLQDDLAGALRAMTIDRMHHAVIEPGARVRAFMQRGTQPGTIPGELLRYVGQFKSFPVALIQMTLGREVYGRGYDTLGEYMRNGRGEMLGLVSFLALSAAMGYAAMSAKDLLRGKNPRPLDRPSTWAAAFVQGGGLGLYGDFLFGKYNRMGSTLSGSLAGPVANVADTLADLWTRIRTGDDVAAASFKALLDNTPFMNLFYVRSALDYAILYRIQEALNPGFLRRMERRAQTEYGQTFYLPPSQVAQ
jgi:hypothetical protein